MRKERRESEGKEFAADTHKRRAWMDGSHRQQPSSCRTEGERPAALTSRSFREPNVAAPFV